MAAQLRGLCSMATKGLLGNLSDAMRRNASLSLRFEAAGGVEVARMIRAGTQADLVVLTDEDMTDLDADGLFEAGTAMPLFVSEVVAAVAKDATSVPFATEHDLRAALVGADRIAYSTGPSGRALLRLLDRWALVDDIAPKLLQAPPGVPVGSLLAGGLADLGFQQRSELSDLLGVRVLGPLPGAAAIRSTFGGAVLARSADVDSAEEALRFLSSRGAEEHVLAAGMTMAGHRPCRS